MTDRIANLLGVVSLAVADRIAESAREILSHSGETPAALVVIGYGFGPSNEQLRNVLHLSHPGAVRLVDRLVADALVERRKGRDRRSIALYLTEKGHAARDRLLKGRIAAIRPFVDVLGDTDAQALEIILERLLGSLDTNDGDRCHLCRLCDDRVCTNCPIPADFRGRERPT